MNKYVIQKYLLMSCMISLVGTNYAMERSQDDGDVPPVKAAKAGQRRGSLDAVMAAMLREKLDATGRRQPTPPQWERAEDLKGRSDSRTGTPGTKNALSSGGSLEALPITKDDDLAHDTGKVDTTKREVKTPEEDLDSDGE